MKIFKTSFEDTLPVEYPSVPPPGASKEEIIEWVKEFEKIADLNDQHFKQALTRIKVCAFFQGFLHAFDHDYHFGEQQHFRWCPAEYWSKPRGNIVLK